MKGGSILGWRTVSALGSSHPGAGWSALGWSSCSDLGWRGPALWASGVSESRHGGGRSFYLDACGRLGRRDERTQQALRCISRALVSAPAVDHRVSRWRRPAAGGVAAPSCRGGERMSENFAERYLLEEQGGQNYSGALLRLMILFGESSKKSHTRWSNFWRSRVKLARPYMSLLCVLILFTVPSTGP
jgi:hypothetical protein